MNLEGLRLTTIARTLADLGSVCAPEVVESALEEALRRDRTSIEELGLLLGQISGKGCRGTKTLRALIENHCGTATGSELEVEFERFCRRHRLPKAVRQYPVHDTDGSIIGRVDFAYPDYKVAIEIEGFEYHSGRIRFDTDLERHNRLVAIAWRALRLTKMHLTKEGVASAQKIKKLLRA